jgi:hypothetical protein
LFSTIDFLKSKTGIQEKQKLFIVGFVYSLL